MNPTSTMHTGLHDYEQGEQSGFRHRIYVPDVLKGLGTTLYHWFFRKKITLEYPEAHHVPRKGYRGEHRLKRDEQGRPKCTACFMCATACPARCIKIVAGPTPAEWKDRDKYPHVFEIDLLRCIYCGYCEEACPCDAIELTETFNIVATSRAEKIYNRDRLLNTAGTGTPARLLSL